jgi:PHP family Zn ribbon phosphoesterase
LIANLGFVPTDVTIEAVEISRHLLPADAANKFPQLKNYPLLQDGDAHRLNEFLGTNVLHMAAPTIGELKKALRREDERSVTFRPK